MVLLPAPSFTEVLAVLKHAPEPAAAGPSLITRIGRFMKIVDSRVSSPGPIAPPRYSPSAETASMLMPVPKSTETQASPKRS